MASSSSSTHRAAEEILPLIPCLHYKDELVSLVCGPNGTRPGKRYYKCIWKDSGKCKFYEWQEGYARWLFADPGSRSVQSQPRAGASADPAPSIQAGQNQARAPALEDHQIAAILGIVKNLTRLNLLISGANLMATALLLAIFILICGAMMICF